MSEQTITENFSEKPRRGRPPLHPPGYLEDLRRLHLVEQNSIRGQQDALYRYDAQAVLWPKGEDREARLERFRWLYDHEAEAQQRPRPIRTTLLAHLGRLRDPELILQAADLLCEWRPKTAAGVAWLRRLRTGRPATGNAVDLANTLIAAFNGYMGRNPETGAATAVHAVERLSIAVSAWAEHQEGRQ